MALVILSQQMIKWLVARRAGVFGDGEIPLFGVGKDCVDVKHDTAKRMLAMPQHLADVIFGRCF